jgi:hypothetical protein
LPAVDRLLDLRIDVLAAKAGAVDPDRGKRLDRLPRQLTRIDLDRPLGVPRDLEALAQCSPSMRR